VLYAPGLTDLGDIKTLVSALDRPVNVLVMPGGPTIPELFEVGVIRVSTGSAISMARTIRCEKTLSASKLKER